MTARVVLLVEDLALSADLNDSETAKALARRLPLKIRMSRWGDEYYGGIGERLDVGPSPDAREDMKVGELAYWIPGNALCIFFGPTPASDGDEPRAASPVNPVGKVVGDAKALAKLGQSITLELEAVSDAPRPSARKR